LRFLNENFSKKSGAIALVLPGLMASRQAG